MKSILVAIACCLAISAVPQGQPNPAVGIEKMKALSFLEGDWSGTASMSLGGRTSEMKGSEFVKYRAGGQVMTIDGKYSIPLPNGQQRVVHDAFAVINWNEKTGYRMRAYLSNGMSEEYPIEVRDKGYTWSQVNPMLGGEVRYNMTLSDQGEWIEIGEKKTQDGKWEKFFELKVKKSSN